MKAIPGFFDEELTEVFVSADELPVDFVITSYSIHYTKLYENGDYSALIDNVISELIEYCFFQKEPAIKNDVMLTDQIALFLNRNQVNTILKVKC